MARELHHDIRRDAVGESEADEGLAAGVGADEFVFGIDFVIAGAVAVACDGVGRVEAADLAEVFEGTVHLLVGNVWKGFAILEVFVFVFLQDGEGVFVEDDGKAVVGLLGGDVEDSDLNIHATDFYDIAVAKAGEGAEAEEVPGLRHGGRILDGLLVFFAFIGFEFENGAAGGDLQVVEFVQLFFGEEDDGLFDGLEDGLIAPQTITASI